MLALVILALTLVGLEPAISTHAQPGDSEKNCVVSLDWDAQVLAWSGTNGGWTTEETGLRPQEMGVGDYGGAPVRLIVIDFFDGNYTIPPELFLYTQLPKQASPNDVPGLSHGAMVYNHLAALLEPGTAQEDIGNILYPIDLGAPGGSLLDTGVVTQKLEWATIGWEERPVVVNMSFALVPCDLIGGDQGDYTEEVANQISLSDDPLYRFIQEHPEIEFVAAAGNSHRPFAFYPAAWPEVVAVGANDKDDDYHHHAAYSNYGDQIDRWEFGGYYLITDPYCRNDNCGVDSSVSVQGTSFAAPVYAARDALEKSQHASSSPSPACPAVAQTAIVLWAPDWAIDDPYWQSSSQLLQDCVVMQSGGSLEIVPVASSNMIDLLNVTVPAGDGPDIVVVPTGWLEAVDSLLVNPSAARNVLPITGRLYAGVPQNSQHTPEAVALVRFLSDLFPY